MSGQENKDRAIQILDSCREDILSLSNLPSKLKTTIIRQDLYEIMRILSDMEEGK